MPLYDYGCNVCGRRWTDYRRVADRDNMTCCAKQADRYLSVTSKPVVYEYYSENLGTQITSPKQKQRVMKEQGVCDR